MREVEPLVSIGLPTYNRAATCKRAIESALGQDYRNLEIIISDNASTDETETICREFSGRDNRIRYVRQPFNQGATKNFSFVAEEANGKYFMWLGDDDWIDANYISQCVQHLEADPDFAIVTGVTLFHSSDEKSTFTGEIINYVDDSPCIRVVSYYKTVGMNESFYGVVRSSFIKRIRSTLRKNVVGGDWLVCAALIFLGKAQTTESTTIHRALGGTSVSTEGIIKSLKVHPFQAKHFWLSASWLAFYDIVIDNPVYRSLPIISRWCMGIRVFQIMLRKHYFPYKCLPRIVRVLQIVIPRRIYEKIRCRYRKETK